MGLINYNYLTVIKLLMVINSSTRSIFNYIKIIFS